MILSTIFNQALGVLLKGIFGFLGGGIFFLSWIYQAYLSKKTGTSMVDTNFWLMRTSGLVLLLIHSLIIKDVVYTLMNIAGILLTLYNVSLIKEDKNVKKKETKID